MENIKTDAAANFTIADYLKSWGIEISIEKFIEYNEEGLDIIALISLPFLMNTSNVTSTKKQTKKQWRPSKQEVLEGFITHVTSPAEIAETVTRKRNNLMNMNLQLQPFIMVIGSSKTTITARYVIVNNVQYEMPSITKAVDAFLKVIFVLNASIQKNLAMYGNLLREEFLK